MLNHSMGWRRDQMDHRDRLFGTPAHVDTTNLPSAVSLVEHCPPVYDQQALGSCSANAVAGAFEFDAMKQGLSAVTPSRLFIYYFERALEGTVATDSGARLRDGIKVLNSQGVCPESEWPYDIAQFAVEPSVQAQSDARRDRAVKYARVMQSTMQMRATLAGGYPIVLGFSVFESFMSAAVAQTGIAPMPQPDEQVVGGHAVVVVGYTSDTWICRNSWGTQWAAASPVAPGYFTLPVAYLTDPQLASDLWVVQVVSEQ